MPLFYAGTSNVVLPVPNKQAFPTEYQNKSRLCYYGSLFNSVEINSTFYKLPLGATVAKWAVEVPGNFRFTFKLWQEITHQKGLNFDPDLVHRFLNVINFAGDKKGCLLIQFPPSTTIDLHQLHSLLLEIRQADPGSLWKIAVEFRNRSWYEDNVYEILDEHQAGMVLHDLPASAAPMQTGNVDFVYLRFHGPNGGYRGSYDDNFLYEYAQYIHEWMQDGKTVYAYFNNTMGQAVQNLITLNRFVHEL
ncbi:DUF72 domain-containing protein [Mucilaginibacter robiniae]|uniref:DUF72 domain-containing protein n=2 Tax=Mucilaginibacter robiniae TaxID=2728022 RepID=A0A7L5EBX4_9SPHI|nr:DUF72 domain-containing protein [Mucilaginibacter robiniae]